MHRNIECSNCQEIQIVEHMDWSKIICLECGAEIENPLYNRGFDEDKANQIIDLLEELFGDDIPNAGLHCCAVLLGLSADTESAVVALNYVASVAAVKQ